MKILTLAGIFAGVVAAVAATPTPASPAFQLAVEYPILEEDVGRQGYNFFHPGMSDHWSVTHGLAFSKASKPGMLDGRDRVRLGRAPDGRTAIACLAPQGEVQNWNFRTLGERTITTGPIRAMAEIWIPDGFAWGREQRLAFGVWGGGGASFYGGKIAPERQDGFFVGLAHSPEGGVRLYSYHRNRAQPRDAEGAMPATFSPAGGSLPTGRWVALQLDVEVNTPGEADGSARLFVDGELRTELTGLEFRTTEANWTVRGLLLHDQWGETEEDPANHSPCNQQYWYSGYKFWLAVRPAENTGAHVSGGPAAAE